jgi:hypothetical protein
VTSAEDSRITADGQGRKPLLKPQIASPKERSNKKRRTGIMADQFNVTKKEALVVTAEILEYLENQWLKDSNQPIGNLHEAILESLDISDEYFSAVRLKIESLLEKEGVPIIWCESCLEERGNLPVRKATTHTSCYGWSGYELCQPCADHLDSEPCPVDSSYAKRCDYHKKGEQG